MPQKPRIHLVSLFSVGNDADLLPYFIEHYDNLGLDNHAIFLHGGEDEEINLLCEKALLDASWRVRRVPFNSTFGDGQLKRVLFEKFQKAIPKWDYMLMADADEFQMWEEVAPQEVLAQGFDMVTGRKFDRFSETLHGVEMGMTLQELFPLEHSNLSKVIFPTKTKLRDKIIMAKAVVPVEYKKCLGLTVRETPKGMKIMSDVPVQHFKWREGIFERLATRSDYTPSEIEAIRSFFSHDEVPK